MCQKSLHFNKSHLMLYLTGLWEDVADFYCSSSHWRGYLFRKVCLFVFSSAWNITNHLSVSSGNFYDLRLSPVLIVLKLNWCSEWYLCINGSLHPKRPCSDKLIEEQEIVEGTENVWTGESAMASDQRFNSSCGAKIQEGYEVLIIICIQLD